MTAAPAPGLLMRLAIPAGLMAGAVALLALWPASASWPDQAWFCWLPYILCAAAAILGMVFTQSRMLFVGAVTAVLLVQLDQAWFIEHDTRRGQAVLLLASLFLPPVVAVFYRLNERGLFTPYGALRAVALLILLGSMFTLSLSGRFQVLAGAWSQPEPAEGGGWLGLPGLGLVALVFSAPFLIWAKRGESPLLGVMLLVALVFVFTGFGCRAVFWRADQQRTVLLLFGALGAVSLLGALVESLWRHMNIDELTELPGRRAFRHHLRCLGEAYTIALVDIDHFKRINDTYGHATGDQVLKFIASELSRQAGGRVFRYGGEEFVVVYEKRSYQEALKDLDALRDAIAHKEFLLRLPDRPAKKEQARPANAARTDAERIAITISVGAARPDDHAPTPQAVLDCADQALYQAKEKGRNRLCHYT